MREDLGIGAIVAATLVWQAREPPAQERKLKLHSKRVVSLRDVQKFKECEDVSCVFVYWL